MRRISADCSRKFSPRRATRWRSRPTPPRRAPRGRHMSRIWCCSTSGCRTPTASRLLREWSVTDGYDCPVVMMSGHGTVETAVEATRLGAFDFVEKPLSLTKLLENRRAGARCRPPQAPVRAHPGLEPGRSHRQEQAHSNLARTGAASRDELLAGAVHRRIGLRTRGLRALSALLERPLGEAVFHGGGGEFGGRSRAAPVRQRARRQSRARRVRPGGGRLAVLEWTRGSEQRGAARTARRDRAKRLHAGGRPRATAAQRALDQFGAGRVRVARGARAVSARSDRASQRDHLARAAAARLCRGRA